MSHEITLYCNTEQLAILRQFLDSILQDTPLSEVDQHQVILAVEEVCANLMIHSHGCKAHESIDLNAKIENENLIFEIKDLGEGFNILEYQEPDLSHVVKTKRKGGLGIILVKKIMDKIEFESNGTKNICRLFKALNSK